MLERISAIIFNCREALGKLEELRSKIQETVVKRQESGDKIEEAEIKRQELDVKIQDIGIKSQETVFKKQETGIKIEEDEEIKELNQQTITIAERYIIFHDAVVKLEGMVKEISSEQSSAISDK